MSCDAPTVNVISTGSKGNAVVLNDHILIDCGVPFRALESIYKDLKLVLLTHVHGDHFNPETIKRLHFLRPALRFACCDWLIRPLLRLGVHPHVVDRTDPCNDTDFAWYIYRPSLWISCVSIPHDAPNCAWRIKDDGSTIFYATDCGSLDGITARGYDLYLIEANYGEEELASRQARKLAAGEFSYESRAAATHLSQEQADAWLAENADAGRSKVLYLHRHQESEATA